MEKKAYRWSNDTICGDQAVNLDYMKCGELPALDRSGVKGLHEDHLVKWVLPGVTLWLRESQIDEIIALLKVAPRELKQQDAAS